MKAKDDGMELLLVAEGDFPLPRTHSECMDSHAHSHLL